MMRTHLLSIVAVMFLAAVAPVHAQLSNTFGGSGGSGGSGVQRPNIIFLLTDDHRFDALGCYGNAIIQTPELDRLAAEGVLFENCFVTTSICWVNRASIFTGQYASRHGLWRNSGFSDEVLHDGTYVGKLKQAGYRMGFIGKWGVGKPPEGLFDYNEGFPGQGRYIMEVDGETKHLTGIMGDQAIEFLEGSEKDKPFCLSISFKAGHVQDSYDLKDDPFPSEPDLKHLYKDVTIPPPVTAAHEYYDRMPDFLKDSENRKRWAIRFWGPQRYQDCVKDYYRLISGVDRVVGRIRRQLEQMGAAENTIIIFTGDNGFYLGEYGFAGKWYGHEPSIHVPLIVYDPRQAAELRGARREEMVLSIDLAPTMLDMARVGTLPAAQGVSLTPLLKRGGSADWRDSYYYEHLVPIGTIPQSVGYRDRRWKYLRYVDHGFEEMYDLAADPHEARNLALDPVYKAKLEELRRKCDEAAARAK